MHRSKSISIRSPSLGKQQEEIRNREAEPRQIDHQFVLRLRLHRQVGRLLPLEDAIDVAERNLRSGTEVDS
jgi:hypothetical protein